MKARVQELTFRAKAQHIPKVESPFAITVERTIPPEKKTHFYWTIRRKINSTHRVNQVQSRKQRASSKTDSKQQ